MITSLDEMLHITFYTYNVNAPYYIENLDILNDRIFCYSRILRRIYTFHIQCIIKVEDLNALNMQDSSYSNII
jgi:hypothetical protein